MSLLVALVTVALAAVPPLLAVQHGAATRCLARLWQTQQTWAEMMEPPLIARPRRARPNSAM